MKRLFAIILSLLALVPQSFGQSFGEGFDAETETSVSIQSSNPPSAVTTWVDYSDFTVGTTQFSIPEAPNQVPGSAPTRGLLMQMNVNGDGPGGINVFPADAPDGSPLTFSGDYVLEYDMYISIPNPIHASATENGLWGIGSSAGSIHSFGNRTDPTLEGAWGWFAGEAGYATDDAVFMQGSTELQDYDNAADAGVFYRAFPDQRGEAAPHLPNSSWIQVRVEVVGGQVSVSFNNSELFSFAVGDTEGAAFAGYEDPFSSVSTTPDVQWGLIDNLRVTTLDDALLLELATDFEVVDTEDGTSTAVFTLTNNGDAERTVSGVVFSSFSASQFSLVSSLPLVIAPGSAETFEVRFDPFLNGERFAKMEVVTDDPVSPSIRRYISATRAVAFDDEGLLAYYKMEDDGADLQAFDSSPNAEHATHIGASGNLFHDFMQRPVAGDSAASTYYSRGTNGSANYTLSPVEHTPTVSYSVWVRPTVTDVEQAIVNRDPVFDTGDGIYGLVIESDGSVVFNVAGDAVVASEAGVIEAGEAHHIVVTHLDEDGFENATATRTRLYINGEMVDENLSPAGFGDYGAAPQTTSLYIGSKSASGIGFDGYIDNLGIYSTELDQAEVSAIFSAIDDPNLNVLLTGELFGTVNTFDPVVRSLTIENNGDSEELVIGSASITGTDSEHFSIVSPGFPATVPVGEELEIQIEFDPMQMLGAYEATLELSSNDASSRVVSVELSVEANHPTGLVAHYRMDEQIGATMIDSSGAGIDGEYDNAAEGSYTLGREALAAGSAALFDDGYSVSQNPNSAGFGEVASGHLPDLQSFSLSMWVRRSEADGGVSTLASKGGFDTGPWVLYYVADSDSSSLFFNVAGNNAASENLLSPDQSGESPVKIIAGQTQHLVLTFLDENGAEDGAARVRAYLDGSLVFEAENPAGFIDSGGKLQLGAVSDGFGFTGLMDDVQLYEREMTADEVAFLYENPGQAVSVGDGDDTDADGLPDSYEQATFGGLDQSGDGDFDGDTFTNLEEFIAGTDPTTGNSLFAVGSISVAAGEVSITFPSKAGATYVVEVTVDLKNGTWEELTTVTGEAGSTTVTDNAEADRRFYRVRAEP